MANYDLNSITHGNDTYNLKDNSKIPLSGSNAISGSLIPATTDTYDLGGSSYQWKTINGIAPDELGLPTSTYTDTSSYITNLSYGENTFTSPASGLLYINGSGGDFVVQNVTLGFFANYNRNPHFGNCRGMIPVNQGDIIKVFCDFNTLLDAKIYQLKGKV